MICNAHEHSHKILELFALKFSNSNTIKLHLVSSTQYIYIYIFFFIEGEFWQIYRQITFSSYTQMIKN